MLGPQRRAELAAGLDAARRQQEVLAAAGAQPGLRTLTLDAALEDVDRRRTDEARYVQRARSVVNLERRADLLDAAAVHHHHAVGHRHRLHLIVRDVDRGRAQALVQGADFGAHRDAQLGVEVGQRLVEQEHARLAHDGPTHRDALALPAGQLARKAFEQLVEIQHARRLSGLGLDLGGRRLAQAQAEIQVVAHVQVRVQRIALEHHRDVAFARLELVDALAADRDLAGRDRLQPRDHAQQGRLAAARGADQHHELAVGDFEVDALHHRGRAVGLVHPADAHRCHENPVRTEPVRAEPIPFGLRYRSPSPERRSIAAACHAEY